MLELVNETINAKAIAIKDMEDSFNGRPLVKFDDAFDFLKFYHDSENWWEDSWDNIDFERNEEYYAPIA